MHNYYTAIGRSLRYTWSSQDFNKLDLRIRSALTLTYTNLSISIKFPRFIVTLRKPEREISWAFVTLEKIFN